MASGILIAVSLSWLTMPVAGNPISEPCGSRSYTYEDDGNTRTEQVECELYLTGEVIHANMSRDELSSVEAAMVEYADASYCETTAYGIYDTVWGCAASAHANAVEDQQSAQAKLDEEEQDYKTKLTHRAEACQEWVDKKSAFLALENIPDRSTSDADLVAWVDSLDTLVNSNPPLADIVAAYETADDAVTAAMNDCRTENENVNAANELMLEKETCMQKCDYTRNSSYMSCYDQRFASYQTTNVSWTDTHGVANVAYGSEAEDERTDKRNVCTGCYTDQNSQLTNSLSEIHTLLATSRPRWDMHSKSVPDEPDYSACGEDVCSNPSAPCPSR